MKDEYLNSLISNIRRDEENNYESQNKLFEKYYKEVTYYFSHVLVYEKNVTKYVNSTFDKLFKIVKNLDYDIDASEFINLLNNIMFEECNRRLEEHDHDYKQNWVEASFDFITNFEELEPGSSEDPALYSENCKLYVLNMMKELPSNERIVAYSYYFLDMTVERMAEIIGIDRVNIEKYLKSIRFNIETNIRFANSTQDTIQFTKQTIKTYLYYDYNNSSNLKYDESKKDQFNQDKPNEVYVNQSNESQNISSNQTNKKQSILLFVILGLAIILIAGIVAISIKLIMANSMVDTTSSETTINTTVPVTEIQISQNPLYIKVGESITLDYTISPNNASTNDMTKMVNFDNMSGSNADWCYRIQNNDIIKYDPATKKLTGLKVGNSQFSVFSLKFEKENGELISSLIFVYVIDKNANIELDQTIVNLKAGETRKINYVVTPDSSYNVNWSSSNDNIATVDSTGIITGKSSGSCIITASISNTNIKKEISVNVSASSETVNASFKTAKSSMASVGDMIDLSYDATPSKEYVKLEITADGFSSSEAYVYESSTNIMVPLKQTRYVVKLLNALDNTIIQVIVIEVR